MAVVAVLAVTVLTVAVFALLLLQRNDPERTVTHEVDPVRGDAYQPGDGRPAGPGAEATRPVEGDAVPGPERRED